MARMYELTRDRKYLDHLREFIELALQYRDDHYDPGTAPYQPGTDGYICGATSAPYSSQPTDYFRGLVMPGWGGSGPDTANFNFVPEVVAGLYGYSIALFSRLVAEDSSLQATYGNDALRYANAVLETAWAFMPQLSTQSVANFFEAHLAQLDVYRTKPSTADCQNAYNQEKSVMDAANAQATAAGNTPPYDQQSYSRLSQQKSNCDNLSCVAGAPLAHNESGVYAMMLIELWRVLDSGFYQHSGQQASNAGVSRTLFPILIARFYRYFSNRLHVVSDARGDRFTWHYQDDQPSCVNEHDEDVSHGAFDMRYVEVLRRSFELLAAPAAKGNEPIPLDLTQLQRFANTFLEKIASGTNFNNDVDGASPSPDANGLWENNGLCDGWLNLAVADANIYRICHDTTLLAGPNSQPYLGIANHSALLMNKPFSASLVSVSGKVTFLRVNDVGGGFGSPIDFLDAEVIVQVDTQPGKSFGFQLRTDAAEGEREGMLAVLRSAFRRNSTVTIDYLRNGAQNGRVIRVAKVN